MAPSPIRFLWLAFVLASCTPALGQQPGPVQWNITLRDLPEDLKANEELIKEHLIVAAEMWTDVIVPKPCSIEIEFKIKPWSARGFGHSLAGVPIGGEKIDGKSLVEEGMSYELRTGKDPNGARPDVEMAFDPEYVKTLWWDPKPRTRKRPMPNNKLDAVSVIAHELGHAIAFNGRIDPRTGEVKGGEISPYDRWAVFEKGDFFFTGPAATALYHKRVPLSKTQNNYHHFGEPGPRLDRKLNDDLMNGLFMQYGKRYVVSDLDRAILADCGLELKK